MLKRISLALTLSSGLNCAIAPYRGPYVNGAYAEDDPAITVVDEGYRTNAEDRAYCASNKQSLLCQKKRSITVRPDLHYSHGVYNSGVLQTRYCSPRWIKVCSGNDCTLHRDIPECIITPWGNEVSQ